MRNLKCAFLNIFLVIFRGQTEHLGESAYFCVNVRMSVWYIEDMW